eukprot:5406796-Amphidinium_carterae.1
MYRPDVQPQQQQQQQQASGSGTQRQQQPEQQQQQQQPVAPAAKTNSPTPAREKAMPATRKSKKRKGRPEPDNIDVVDLVADSNVDVAPAKASATATASSLIQVGQRWIPAPPPATTAMVAMHDDVYDIASIPAPLIEQAVTGAIQTADVGEDAAEQPGPKRHRVSSGSLVGSGLSVSWTRFGLHERLKQTATGATPLQSAPWHSQKKESSGSGVPPPKQEHALSNRDRVSAIRNFVQAAVSAPWRQATPMVVVVAPPPPPVPVRVTPPAVPVQAPEAAVQPAAYAPHMPRAIPVPPQPRQVGAPPTSSRDIFVTPPLTRRALAAASPSTASPSSKYASPAVDSPDFAFVRPAPSPPSVLQNMMPPPPPLKRVPPPPAPLKNGGICDDLVSLSECAPCPCSSIHVHVGALAYVHYGAPGKPCISGVCDFCVAAFKLVVHAVASSLARMASLPSVRIEIWRARLPSRIPRLNLARLSRERENYGALDLYDDCPSLSPA